MAQRMERAVRGASGVALQVHVRVYGLTTDGAAIVDATHIEPFAENQNDSIENDLAIICRA